MRVAPTLVLVTAAMAAPAACGSAGDATVSTPPAPAACAFVGPIRTATGVGPVVVFVTRGAGARKACDAEIADPRNASRHFTPAYVPSGSPACTYYDGHDQPPEGRRTYELYGNGASTVCEAIAHQPDQTPPPGS